MAEKRCQTQVVWVWQPRRAQGSWVRCCNQPKALRYSLADRPKALGSSVRTRSSWVRRCNLPQGSQVQSCRPTKGSWVQCPGCISWVWRLDPRLLGPALQPDPRLLGLQFKRDPKLLGQTFKRGPKLLDLALQPDPHKFGSDKFNIIINIKMQNFQLLARSYSFPPLRAGKLISLDSCIGSFLKAEEGAKRTHFISRVRKPSDPTLSFRLCQ